ncbi:MULTISPECIES: hypothetical protein [unclassified Pseudoalteromonas]|uniref:hypothetical protein n=1 Tax=unclassified Pseudoalteromonas TaxID=194690 RepID=UPI0005A6CC5F|nr:MULTISPECIES: hypothetical protein [unclassified Pseudoalteromonas]
MIVEKQANLIEENKNRNEALATELHFELLKQYAWLASSIIGVIVILIQLKVVEIDRYVYVSIPSLAISIFISIISQDKIVDSLSKGETIYCISKSIKVMRFCALGLLSFGAGFFTAGLV